MRGDCVERGQRLGLVQRREVGELLELPAYAVIDLDRTGEGRATVHYAVTDDLRSAPAVENLG
ncbi:MAG: hypothetical protein ACR2JG_13895 [Geodermatophilaceae bacterium]